MVVWRRKSHQRAAAIERVHLSVTELLSVPHMAAEPPVLSLMGTLDPAAGELDEGRAERKRQQILSCAAHAMRLIPQGGNAVEFGAGSGHLGLLIAHLRPDCRVTLVELKQHACDRARERIRSLELIDVRVFQGTVDEFAATRESFDVALGLHLCGLLTDAALELAIERGASVCIVPCCYGQIFSIEDHFRGGRTIAGMHPRSTAFRDALGDSVEDFRAVAKGADLAVCGKGGAFDATAEPFLTAARCMTLVDTDRLRWVLESNGREVSVALGRLSPLTCSPKNRVLIVKFHADNDDKTERNGLMCLECRP